MMSPSIGRIVWYHPPYAMPEDDKVLLPGIVCFVHNDRMVNLAVFDIDGYQWGAKEVQLLQDDDVINDHINEGYAEWMPFQIKQNVKHQAEDANGRDALGTAQTPNI